MLHPFLLQAFLATFRHQAGQEVEAAEQSLAAAEGSFAQVAGYLNGSSNKLEATAFFDLVTGFSNTLEKAHDDNAAADAKVERASGRILNVTGGYIAGQHRRS